MNPMVDGYTTERKIFPSPVPARTYKSKEPVSKKGADITPIVKTDTGWAKVVSNGTKITLMAGLAPLVVVLG